LTFPEEGIGKFCPKNKLGNSKNTIIKNFMSLIEYNVKLNKKSLFLAFISFNDQRSDNYCSLQKHSFSTKSFGFH
jgi:hypothetical protein